MKITDTIAAISTSTGNSGIGIIRVSGDEAIEIVDKIFKSNKEGKRLINVKSHTVNYGNIVDGEKVLDQVLVLVMKNPHSYTGEDTVEIDCHGGMLILKKVLDLVIKNGAKSAAPGEFTKRAFLNGRLDLSQAEAVMDLINSQNDFALNSSIEQLKGGVSEKIKEIRSDVIYHIAFIESALDDPEHISLDGYDNEISEMINKNISKIKKMIDTFDNGRIMKEGIKTVILGKPNAGKSSLLNRMLGEERAIVTDIEGTTRDTLEENINLNGLSLKIIDTAGIRNTDDKVEQIGVNKAKEIAEGADLIIYVVDGSKDIDENDKEILEIIKNKKGVYVLTPTLNQMFKFQSDWPYNNSQVYLIQSILDDILDDEERNLVSDDNGYIFTTSVNYPNNRKLVKQIVTFDKKLNLKKVSVVDENNISQMTMTFATIDLSPTVNSDTFDLNKINKWH